MWKCSNVPVLGNVAFLSTRHETNLPPARRDTPSRGWRVKHWHGHHYPPHSHHMVTYPVGNGLLQFHTRCHRVGQRPISWVRPPGKANLRCLRSWLIEQGVGTESPATYLNVLKGPNQTVQPFTNCLNPPPKLVSADALCQKHHRPAPATQSGKSSRLNARNDLERSSHNYRHVLSIMIVVRVTCECCI